MKKTNYNEHKGVCSEIKSQKEVTERGAGKTSRRAEPI